VFGRQLADAVRRDGFGPRVFAHRHRRAVAVHRRARRIDDPLQTHLRAGLEQDLRGLDVVDRVDAKIAAPAFPHARLRGKMKDVRAIGEERGEIGLLDARFDQREARVAHERDEVAFLHRTRVVVREAIEADHVCPVGQ